MQARDPSQNGDGRPGVAGLLVWVGMILLALLGFVLLPAVAGPFERSWPVWLMAAVMYVGIFSFAMALCHPLRGRTNQTQSWRKKFPTHDDREVQRFLQVVGESLGLKEERMRRLRPDDRPEDLTQEIFCGDGMDLVELMMAIERAYGLELPDCLVERARTLGDLFDYVTRQAATGVVPPGPKRAEQSDSG